MNNKNIESKYTIEYIYPDSSSKTTSTTSPNIGIKLFSSISILGLLALGIASSLYYPFISNTSDPIADSEDTIPVATQATEKEEQVAHIDESKSESISTPTNDEELSPDETIKVTKIIEEEIKQASVEQAPKHNKLIEQLNQVSQQLSVEKEKNKQLSSLFNLNKNKTNELSKMLKEALNKASAADTRYLNALSHLDDNSVSQEELVTTKTKDITDAVAQQTPSIPSASIAKNTITIPSGTQTQVNEILTTLEKETHSLVSKSPLTKSLETSDTTPAKTSISQVDAIVAAMGNVNLTPKRKAIHPPTQPSIILQATETITKKQQQTELLHIKLQQQINELITSNELQSSGYSSALETESVARNNALRSITVRKGDTLWDIARRAYGNGSYYKKIIEANPEVTKKGKIYLKEGQIIQVPI